MGPLAITTLTWKFQSLLPLQIITFPSKKTVTQFVVTIMILLLIQILFNLHDASGLKDAECCSLTYVDPNRTELSNDSVLPFQLSKLFSPLCTANLTAGKWKVICTRGLQRESFSPLVCIPLQRSSKRIITQSLWGQMHWHEIQFY